MSNDSITLSDLIILLLSAGDNAYYGSVFQLINRIENKDTPFPAGVSFHNNQYYLHVNPDVFFSDQFTLQNRLAILIHEALHIILLHIARAGDRNKMIWNLATDIAINQMISGLPDKCVSHTQFNLPPGKDAEWYYNALLNKAVSVAGFAQIDDHSKWSGSATTADSASVSVKDAEIMEAVARDLAKQAKMSGNMPAGLEQLIPIAKPLLPWNVLMRRFMLFAMHCMNKSSFKRLNRRFDVPPGNTHTSKLRLYVGVDTSASIQDKDLSVFLGELSYIAHITGVDLTVVEFDTQIQKIYKVKRAKIDPKVKGRGGTAFQPFLDLAYKEKADVAVVLTDGYGEDNLVKPSGKTKVAWILTPDSKQPANFGTVIHIPKY